MKKKNTTITVGTLPEGKLMTRKQAIRKSGYMALSAATMMMLLHDSAKGQAVSGTAAPATPNSTSPQKRDGIWND